MGETELKPAKARRVLAVDDEEEILRLYNTFLKFNGYDIHSVQNAEACIDYLMKEHVDIILLDVNMPGIDGLRLLEMIRSQPKCKETPIIMISARGDESTVKKAALIGCDNFIVKPFSLNDLVQRIEGELFELNVDQVKLLLDEVRNVRTRLLREAGLQDFRVLEWDPYYLLKDQKDLCIMIPRGVRPNSLARLSEDELRRRIVVFYKHPIRWKKIWPLE